ncbi:hypothetical protein acdb102_22320 [Acidothermaceae bacterium B102]|nr:hypothetical protein acdb102_22320 [Acidothermaceae bacterium B102]
MKRRVGRVAALVVAAASIGLSSVPAQAATVPNFFYRTCTWSCSSYVQSNGPYNPNVISQCITRNWWWGTASYYQWGRC